MMVFNKLVAVYRDFAIDGRRAEEVVKELLHLSEHLGIMDVKLEGAILKAFKTGSMVDVEIAKELFHGRLKMIDKVLLGGVDPFALFSQLPPVPSLQSCHVDTEREPVKLDVKK
jgi:hypothetical protein